MIVVDRDRPTGKQRADHRHAVLQTPQPLTAGIEGDAGALVLGAHPSGAEADVQTAARQCVERCQFSGQDLRDVEVVAQNPRRNAKRGAHLRDDGQSRNRRHLFDQVVRHDEGVVAEALGGADRCHQIRPVGAVEAVAETLPFHDRPWCAFRRRTHR